MENQRLIEGVVAVIEREGELLAIRRAEGIVAGGFWCFPGGAMEPGETPGEAIIREVREEVGLIVFPERLIWQWTRADGLLRLEWWQVTIADDSPPPSANPSEVAEIRWVSRDRFRRLTPLLESNLAFLDALNSD